MGLQVLQTHTHDRAKQSNGDGCVCGQGAEATPGLKSTTGPALLGIESGSCARVWRGMMVPRLRDTRKKKGMQA